MHTGSALTRELSASMKRRMKDPEEAQAASGRRHNSSIIQWHVVRITLPVCTCSQNLLSMWETCRG